MRNVLNIKDPNIHFEENCCQDTVIEGQISKLFSAALTYEAQRCPNCGMENHGYSIVKNGSKKSRIVLPEVSGYPAFLDLNKQRFLCRECSSTFSAQTNIVEKNCFISRATKVSIALYARKTISEKDIAAIHHVSANTTSRVFKSAYNSFKQSYGYLPKHLCFDEFKSVKDCVGAMSFVCCDSATHQVFDILPDRRLFKLREYFLRFPYEVRAHVETVVTDLYSPYMILIKEVFPNAKIIIDRFHIILQVNRALNQTRIQVMNGLRKSSEPKDRRDYTKLKNYWKLLLMDQDKLDFTNYRYHRLFKKGMCDKDVVDYLLGIDPTLKANYDAYQTIKYAVSHKEKEMFKDFLNESHKLLSPNMKKAMKTLKSAEEYILNSLSYTYSNGVIEGINNKIKVIKRVSYGYRNFIHFRNRIFIQFNLLQAI